MNKTVLVVDDDKGVLTTLRNILVSEGFNVLTAHNLNLAREVLNNSDFLVLDINIGPENGLSFIKELREKGVRIPALIMSGLITAQADDMAVKYTLRPVFAKPLDFEAFLSTISDAVRANTPETAPQAVPQA